MNDIEKILSDVDNTITNISHREFTEKAFQKYKESIAIYISSLFVESQKSANRDKADNISTSHVELATKYLVKYSKNKTTRLFGILGGLLLGSTLSNLFSMTVFGQQYNVIGLIMTIIFGIIGSFLIGINIMKE